MDRSCEVCGASYAAKRATAKYCSPKCRKRAADRREAERAAERAASSQVSASDQRRPEPSTEFADRIAAELEAAGRLDTVPGRQALLLARRLEDPETSFGSAAASLSKELREVMAEAMAGVAQAGDPVDAIRDGIRDDLREYRERKRHG